jgi:hypothetical protein
MTLILAALDFGANPNASTIYKIMTEYEEKQARERIQSYRNMIKYMSMQIELLEREINKDKNFEYKFNITKK